MQTTGYGLICLLLLTSQLLAQDIAQGTWRTHFSYNDARIIVDTGSKVFCAVQNGLFYVDRSDNTINTLSKIDGFSDVTISAMGYSAAANTVVIGYENGNIDLFSGEGITNIDLVKTHNIIQDKGITQVTTSGSTAYLATDFGIVVIDLNRQVIDEVYREIGPDGIQPEVFATAVFQDSLFAVTSTGLLAGRLGDNINLLDFNNWQVLNTPVSDPDQLLHAASGNGALFLASATQAYRYGAGNFTNLGGGPFNNISQLKTVNSSVFLLDQGVAYQLTADQFDAIPDLGANQIQDIYETTDGLWLADGVSGLIRQSGANTQAISPNGPASDQIQKLVFQRDSVYALGTFRTDAFLPASQKGYSVFTEGQWVLVADAVVQNVSDVRGPYLASFGNGLFDRTTNMSVPGSTLLPSELQGDATIVPDVASGSQGLWIANRNTSLPLHLLDSEGNWQSFDLSGQMDNIEQVVASGRIWMRENRATGVTVFNPENNEVSRVTAANSELPSSRINDLAIDQDDEVWVATSNGVAFFPVASSDISDFNTALIPVFENNFLFREEVINCITIDPGNRKWFGNTTGAWLLEEAGESLVVQFNVDNSPLPSNNVLDIVINPANGEVFFITDRGMVSYRSDATSGGPVHGDVKIFPNPVRPGFSGLVGISGLASDVRLKITDVSGKLVRELEANGGGASWNLRDINGNRATSGVYLVFSSDREGVETFVGKFVILN